MIVNPKTLGWTAPKTNTDGTEINYALEYEVGIDTDLLPGGYEPLMTVPGQLQDGDRYEAPVEDLGLEPGEHVVALRTFAKDDPARKSEWSEPVMFAISEEIPNAPLDLRVI
jgi:hypothetical protein